ncbi:HSP18 transcriptional regulator [Crossiella sp. SN42]|uniref:HSP18 transcriptional regulator n=1 Tax=Crossiella sp. SN42 TaxID=2944808 RepID=UPI00207C2D09|nr:HSP18 transcriptional regulator [Crossiella sp. SN42]MCO1577599.1 HSP18 transcriptional regulator [Crossiella sp. SN42]
MNDNPETALAEIREVLLAARAGQAEVPRLLGALTALRELREELSAWEPELINAARGHGASWAALAPALGVASRQAAERRFLRLRPSATGGLTAEGRVDAERGKRAGDRAVAAWARRNAAVLRQLAGQVSALGELGGAGQAQLDRVGHALGEDDTAKLLPSLLEAYPYLTGGHRGLAERVLAISDHVDQVRRDATEARGR